MKAATLKSESKLARARLQAALYAARKKNRDKRIEAAEEAEEEE